ncbi:AAA domain protein [uncultured Leptotrichia sp.]|nr:AAA domain protein [uncultured Leptotrichia sp.]
MKIPCGIRRVRVLLDIEIKNLKSFKNQTIFSMEAENKIEDRNSFEVEVGKEKFELLKTAVLFGGNASGKSNFTSVLSIFRYYLFNKGIEKYNKEGFRFGEEDKNSTIKVRNVVDDKIYEYILEINFNTKKIIKEKLYITALERKLVFERENNKIVKYDKETFSEYEITIGFINETLTDSDSVISRIIEWRVPEEIEKYIFYIDKIKINNYSDDLGKYIYENKNNKKLVIEFLKKIGIIVNDIEVYREKNEFFLKNIRESKEFQILSEKEQEKLLSQIAYIYRIHFVYEDNQKQKYKLEYYEQSAGTQKILSMFFPIYNLLNNGGVMIIDELDITLHYSLIKEIIKMFNSVEYNRKNAQLIFTTHNLLLLDFNLFREDQIWFLENNDVSTGTELYSLSDVEGYEKNKYLLRDYLNGNFGGIPKLKDFGVDLWLEKKE